MLPLKKVLWIVLLVSSLQAGATASSEPQAGVVVEGVKKNFEAEKAGLREGDLILRWVRGDMSGEIASPFDLSAVETEQEPRGAVTLSGSRGSQQQTWTLGPNDWGIDARPLMPDDVLVIYLEGQKLAKAGEAAEAAQRWHAIIAQTDSVQPTWLRAWVLAHAAGALAEAQRWDESDHTYQEAVSQAADGGPTVAAPLLQIWAKTFENQSDWNNAEKHFQQSIAEYRKLSDREFAIAATLDELGLMYGQRGGFEKAEGFHRQALDIEQKLAPGSLAVARSLANLGTVARSRGDLPKAEELYRQSLDIRQRLAPDSLAVAASLNYLGSVAYFLGDFPKATEYYRRSLDIRQKLAPGTIAVAKTFNNLGLVLLLQGDLAKAEEYHLQALNLYQKLEPVSLDVAGSFNNLGLVASEQGELRKAEKYHLQALEIQQKLAPDSPDVAETLGSLGIVARYRGDFASADKYYHSALDLETKFSPDSLVMAATLNNLGTLSDARGDLAIAERYQLQALAIREKLAPNSIHVATSLGNLGDIAQERGDLTRAENYYLRSLAIVQKTNPDSIDLIQVLTNLGGIAEKRGDLVAAENYLRQALVISEKLAPESIYVAQDLEGLGSVASDRGDLIQAEGDYRRGLAIREKLAPGTRYHAETLAALAEIMLRKGQTDVAAKLFEQSLDVLENQMAYLGGGDEVRAGFRANYSIIYADYIDLLMEQKQPDLAFSVAERSRAQSLLEMLTVSHVDIRKGADSQLLEQERSLQHVVVAKANQRLQLLQGAHSEEQLAAVNKETENVLTQYREVETRVRESSPGYAALTQPKTLRPKDVQQRLLDANTVLLEYLLGNQHSYVWAVTPNSIRGYFLPKSTEIEASAGQLYQLLAARNRSIKGETEEQQDTRVAKADEESQAVATQLSQMVLAPVAAEIQGKRLLIVSDGALQYIPFALLPEPEAPNAVAGDKHKPGPLIAQHEVINLPSASALTAIRQGVMGRAKPPKIVAVLADPVFDKEDSRLKAALRTTAQRERARGARSSEPQNLESQNKGSQDNEPQSEYDVGTLAGLPPVPLTNSLTRSLADVGLDTTGDLHLARLPFTREEASAIIATAPPGQAMSALDFKASRETATNSALEQYRIVHFATHGLLDSRRPQLSGLVLSLVDERGQKQDGFLTLEDIYNLTLPAELVVLSACETGLGKEIKGEGLLGLTRGFLYAGAERVLASLWQVDDVATAKLMGTFYKAMVQQGMSPAAALRKAQMELWEQKHWSAPYYWAAFQLQGEWK